MDRRPAESNSHPPPAKEEGNRNAPPGAHLDPLERPVQPRTAHGHDGRAPDSPIRYLRAASHEGRSAWLAPTAPTAPTAPSFPDAPARMLSSHTPMLASLGPWGVAAAAAPAPTDSPQHHRLYSAVATAIAAQEALIEQQLRLRQYLNPMQRADCQSLAWTRWETDANAPPYGSGEFWGALPLLTEPATSASLSPRLPQRYYHASSPALLRSESIHPAPFMSGGGNHHHRHHRLDVEALLRQGLSASPPAHQQQFVSAISPHPPRAHPAMTAAEASPLAALLAATPVTSRSRSDSGAAYGLVAASSSPPSSSIATGRPRRRRSSPPPTATNTDSRRKRPKRSGPAPRDEPWPGALVQTPSTGHSPCRSFPMSRHADAANTSRYQCLLREQIEYFEADEVALGAKKQGRNVPIRLGQVGIRCAHCGARRRSQGRTGDGEDPALLKPRGKSARMIPGAVYYPSSLAFLYQAVQNMASNHFSNRACPSAPLSVIERIVEAKRTRPKSSGGNGRRYFGKSAMSLGVVDAPDKEGGGGGTGLVLAVAASWEKDKATTKKDSAVAATKGS